MPILDEAVPADDVTMDIETSPSRRQWHQHDGNDIENTTTWNEDGIDIGRPSSLQVTRMSTAWTMKSTSSNVQQGIGSGSITAIKS